MYVLDQAFQAFSDAWSKKPQYARHYGVVMWATYNWDQTDKAVSIQLDAGEVMNSERGRSLTFTFEILGKAHDNVPPGDQDNNLITEFLNDAEEILFSLYKYKTNSGERLFIEIDETMTFTAIHDATLKVQGVIVTLSVRV